MKIATILAWGLLAAICQGQESPIKITLERTGCFGSCPSYVLDVKDDGTVTFNGRNPIVAPGQRSASIPKETVQELARKLEAAGFFEMPGSDHRHYFDVERIIVEVTIGTRSQRVEGQPDDWPELKKIAEIIDDGAGVDRWIVSIPDQPLLHNGFRNEILKLPLRLTN